MNQPIQMNETYERRVGFRAEGVLDEEARIIEVSVTSEEPYTRQSFVHGEFVEVLGHGADEVDLNRMNNGAPVLYNHDRFDRDNRIGVVEKAWLEDGRVKAQLRISKREEVEGIWRDIQDGILCNVSGSYRVHEMVLSEQREDAPDIYRVTKWELMEASLVDIPADPTVGVGRSDELVIFEKVTTINQSAKADAMKEHVTMPIDETKEAPASAKPAEVDVDAIRAQAKTEALKQENERQRSIREAFAPFGDTYRSEMDACLSDTKVTVERAKDQLLNLVGANQEPVNQAARQVEIVSCERDKFRDAACQAILVRSGFEQGQPGQVELAGYGLAELARMALEMVGESTRNMKQMDFIGRAFSHSSSDFSNIISSVAHKSMLRGFEEAEEVFEVFTRPGNLSNFLPHERVNLSEFSDLELVTPSGEYKRGTFKDKKETIQLSTYGKIFGISREAIINDDLDAFTRVPARMGASARRTVGDLAFAVLTANAAMADGTALFHANHNNLAASGAAPSVATVGAARSAMRKQKGIQGKSNLNIRPYAAIVPVALEDVMDEVINSESNPDKANSKTKNTARNAVTEIVSDPRLDDVSETAWYLAANPNIQDVIEIGYLDGDPNPYLEEQEGFSRDGLQFKVRIDAAAKALSHRTLYKNPGA